MQRSLSMERNGILLCFTMFSIRLLYPIIARIKYDVKYLKYIKLCIYVSSYRPDDGHVIDRNM